MTGLRPTAVALGLASALLCGCGRPAGGGAASSPVAGGPTPAASSAPAPASGAAPADIAASALPPVAAAPPAPAPPAPRRQPAAAELLRDDPAYAAKERTIEALYGNARERDPTGQVEREQASALAERRACADRACLDAWFRRREAALKQYVEN